MSSAAASLSLRSHVACVCLISSWLIALYIYPYSNRGVPGGRTMCLTHEWYPADKLAIALELQDIMAEVANILSGHSN